MNVEELIHETLGSEEASRLVPGKILAVDDDDGNLVVLEAVLSERYRVTTTTSPLQALKLISATEFDMVITDQRMPDMTGVELLKEVRARWPRTVRMVISAYSDVTAILQAINEGEAYRFVLKPWNLDELVTAVKQGMEHRYNVLAIERLAGVLHERNTKLVAALSELKNAQNQLLHAARLATVGQLTAGIAHELKNHLTGIQLLLEVVRGADLPADMAGFVQAGRDSAEALFQLVSGLNAFSRKGAGSLPGPCSVRDVVERAVRLVRTDVRCKKRDLAVRLADELPAVLADGDRLRQVVVNLLRNALDATGDGGRLEVAVGRHASHVEVSVTDDGPGIPAPVRERLFEPFFTTKENGLGLGLGICRQIVEEHGGTLAVDCGVQGGTRVSFRLPLAQEG
jgi:signal transduction histidine kinase